MVCVIETSAVIFSLSENDSVSLSVPEFKYLKSNKGCDVAVASDYNPGSNTIYSIPSVMALATLYCGLTINEVFKAVTFNAAKALNRSQVLGMIKENYIADILFWDINNINEIPYWFNSDRLTYVMKNGKLVYQNDIN